MHVIRILIALDFDLSQTGWCVRIVDHETIGARLTIEHQRALARKFDGFKAVDRHLAPAVGRTGGIGEGVSAVRADDLQRICGDRIHDRLEICEVDDLRDAAIRCRDFTSTVGGADFIGFGKAIAASSLEHQCVAADATIVSDTVRRCEEAAARIIDDESVVSAQAVEGECAKAVECNRR